MVPATSNRATVPDLEEGKEYEFRVIPVNKAGPGEASECTNPVVTKARRGSHPIKFISLEFLLIYLSTRVIQTAYKLINIVGIKQV